MRADHVCVDADADIAIGHRSDRSREPLEPVHGAGPARAPAERGGVKGLGDPGVLARGTHGLGGGPVRGASRGCWSRWSESTPTAFSGAASPDRAEPFPYRLKIENHDGHAGNSSIPTGSARCSPISTFTSWEKEPTSQLRAAGCPPPHARRVSRGPLRGLGAQRRSESA